MPGSDQILSAWKKRKVDPVWVLFGEEEFLRSELLHEAPAIFVPDEATRSFNCDVLYGPETTLEQVLSLARSYPMMAERRLVVVREAERILRAKPAGSGKSRKKSGANEDPLLQYLDNPNPDCILIFDLEKFGPKNQSPFKELAEKATVVEFAIFKEGDVVEWLRERASHLGKNLSAEAARLMTAYLGTALRTHANELEKLISFTAGKSGAGANNITPNDVEQVVGVSRENNVFELTKAIGSGNKVSAVSIALKLLGQGKDQRQFLFIMVARFLEQLTIARELAAKGENERAIAEALELRGGAAYFAKEIIQQARRYPKERLDHALQALVNAELATRGPNVNDELIVESLVLNVMPSA